MNLTKNFMVIKRSKILFLFLFVSISVFAQYTETINSNRPGFSQGAFSVGKDVLQFETGFGLGKEEHSILNKKTDAFIIDYNFRYGIWKEELEISLIGAYQSNAVSLVDSGDNFKESNFNTNTIGAKYLFFDPYRKRQIEKPNLYSWKANNSFKWKD
ncbi:MAG: transporter, partial [Flavobacteriaceae bacterium]|nr:transporter [Flavobacteriaceae bacterium]